MTQTSFDVTTNPLSLSALGLIDYLQCDPRPAFILDKDVVHVEDFSSAQLVFSNDTLQIDSDLLDSIKNLLDSPNKTRSDNVQTNAFSTWLHSTSSSGSIEFCGLLWSSARLHERWVIFSGCRFSKLIDNDENDMQSTSVHGRNEVSLSRSKYSTHSDGREVSRCSTSNRPPSSEDYSQGHSPSTLANTFGVKPTQHNLMVLGFDWAKTSLGPVHAWPEVLRQMVPYMLSGLQPSAILWGADRIMIYNEAYVSLIKSLHPGALGRSARLVFGSFWDDQREPEYRAAELHGAAVHENTQIFMDRSGFLEEAYFTYTITPLWDAYGRCCGADARCFETTRQMVVEARMLSLLKISESATSVTSLGDFWHFLTRSMASNPSDFPLFAIYSLPDSDLISNTVADDPGALHTGGSWVLRGSTGFPSACFSLPDLLDADSNTGLAPAFKAVLNSSGPLLFGEDDGKSISELLAKCNTPELRTKCSRIVVYPLHSSSRNIIGFLALGINPHRPYDDEYEIFVRLLSRQIETQLSPILTLVDERIASQMKAQKSEHEQLLLTIQLEQQTLEARQSEMRFLKFAEHAPIGVYNLNANGGVKFANKAWYKLSGVNENSSGTQEWRLNTHPDDIEAVDDQWRRLLAGYTQEGFEWRAIRKVPGTNDEIIYLRSSCFPELSSDGKLKTVTGILIDLSLERAQQHAQDKSLQDALEARRAQEYFMDMVSHEIRNPLHAVLQLAEETSALLQDFKSATSYAGKDSPIQSCIENVDTIIYCGHHQKQILDDVLTLSKLNSDMLTLSLTDTAPASVVAKVLKFFDSDIRLSNIDISISTGDSGPGPPSSNVLMDSGRVLQILFNLVGNSIKFMKDRPTRKLTVTVQTTPHKPENGSLLYLPSGKKYTDPTADLSSGNTRVAYVYYSVEDTGPGLSSQEMNALFERFKQVSPKTHTQYGGSGLGLFISRELAERHGGEIGLASVVGRGTTFAFYVKCLFSNEEVAIVDNNYSSKTVLQRNPIISSTNGSNMDDLARSSKRKLSFSKNSTTSILIVEDNIVNQKILDRQLRRLGYQTRIAGNGVEALTVLKESSWWHESMKGAFDLSIILCDLEMPIMDGMTCTRTIRDWQQNELLFPDIPIVALTGNARGEQIRAAKEAGFDDVVSKPYSMQNLVSLIERMTLNEQEG